jgi:uncharacterized protein (DUF433 family)
LVTAFGGIKEFVIRVKMGFIDIMKKGSVVKIDPEIMSGTPCFAGTRVPVRSLIDYIEGGDSLDDFLEDFPTVSRSQAIDFLEEACELMQVPA